MQMHVLEVLNSSLIYISVMWHMFVNIRPLQ